MFTDYLNFTEWYHYALLLLWLVILFVGLKYFYKIEDAFKLKSNFENGNNSAVGLLIASFVLGFAAFMIGAFAPETGQSQTANIIFFGSAVLLLLLNAFICFKYYLRQSAIIRLLLISLLMIVYFYSGMLGGLFLIAIFALVVIVFALIKLKNILTIR